MTWSSCWTYRTTVSKKMLTTSLLVSPRSILTVPPANRHSLPYRANCLSHDLKFAVCLHRLRGRRHRGSRRCLPSSSRADRASVSPSLNLVEDVGGGPSIKGSATVQTGSQRRLGMFCHGTPAVVQRHYRPDLRQLDQHLPEAGETKEPPIDDDPPKARRDLSSWARPLLECPGKKARKLARVGSRSGVPLAEAKERFVEIGITSLNVAVELPIAGGNLGESAARV